MTSRSISNSVSLTGVGIHSGKPVTVTLRPALAGTGIVFIRTDLNNARVHVHPNQLKSTQRATLLEENGVKIATPEHLLSACMGLSITDLKIEISGEEVPIMDGSATLFAQALQNAIPTNLDTPLSPFTPQTPLWCQDSDKTVLILPSETLVWTYCLDYPDHFIGQQSVSYINNPDTYIQDIAPARTYGFKAEVDALLARGLAKGGSLDNALVIGETDYINPPRMPNELARHKLLDLMGDFVCFARPIQAHIIGIKSGHNLHMKTVQMLHQLTNDSRA